MQVRTPVDFGLMIRQARRARGITQQELARAAAVGRQWIVEVEAGKPRAGGRPGASDPGSARSVAHNPLARGIPELRESEDPAEGH